MFKEIKINWIAENEIGHDGYALQFPKSALRSALSYINNGKNNMILNFINMYLNAPNNDYIKIQIKTTNVIINSFIPNGIIYITLIGG